MDVCCSTVARIRDLGLGTSKNFPCLCQSRAFFGWVQIFLEEVQLLAEVDSVESVFPRSLHFITCSVLVMLHCPTRYMSV